MRNARLSKGMSRAELARVAGLAEKTVKRWEHGLPITDVSRARINRALALEGATP
jgi:transcriptional regulator with XRE-family HTH domain